MDPGLRGIARFHPTPFYLALSKTRSDLLQKLNNGMNSLSISFPTIQTDLHNKYFGWDGHFRISGKNREYIESLGTLKVLFFDGNAPIQTQQNGHLEGLAVDYMDSFAKATGLKYEPVVVQNFQEALELLNSDQIDLIDALPLNANLVNESGLMLSTPYFTSYGVVVSSPDVTSIDYSSVQVLSANTQSTLQQLRRSRNTSILLDAQLIQIFNSYASNLSDNVRQEMLYKNSQIISSYTWQELVYIYWFPVTIVGVLLLTAIVIAHLLHKNRMLRVIKTESERIYQLSKLTEECLMEYNYKDDVLQLQNNQYVFLNMNPIKNFLHLNPASQFTHSYELEAYTVLKEMLSTSSVERHINLNIGEQKVWFRVDLRYVQDDYSDYAVGRIVNVSTEMLSKQQLQQQASTDGLTGLMNRVAFAEKIQQFLTQEPAEGILLLIDIDNFKCLNVTKCRMAGDQVLRDFAQYMNQFFRSCDWKVRLGGDEFVLFIPNNMERTVLEEKLTQFQLQVKQVVFCSYPDVPLSLSIGACYINPELSTYSALYQAADEAMYVAKHTGKGRWYIHQQKDAQEQQTSDSAAAQTNA